MPQHREVSVNGVTLHIAEQGEGPLVLLLHGFPESWYSWRHQFQPLAEAGYHVVAPDQRGYAGSSQPSDVDDYSIFHLVGDVVGLIHELGHEQAVVIGHDWGAPVAWHTALLRPDLVRGVGGLSVPPSARSPIAPLAAAKERFGEGFYQIYFQQPGVADAELNADIRMTFRKTLAATSGESETSADTPVAPTGGGFLSAVPEPKSLPSWLSESDVDAYTEQYQRNGFTGGLNWYRNIDRNWAQTTPWQHAKITPPALHIVGEADLVRGFYPPDYQDRLTEIAPNLRTVVNLPGCGHWTQQERPDEVNKALLEFLGGL